MKAQRNHRMSSQWDLGRGSRMSTNPGRSFRNNTRKKESWEKEVLEDILERAPVGMSEEIPERITESIHEIILKFDRTS